MSRKLAMHTTVDDVTYPAGSTPPEDVAARITNPKAWAGTNDTPVTKLAAKQAIAEAQAVAAENGSPLPDLEPDEPAEAPDTTDLENAVQLSTDGGDFEPHVDSDQFVAPDPDDTPPAPEPVPSLDDTAAPEPEKKPATRRRRAPAKPKTTK